MADEEKPFVCTEMDCGMRFTNEDHLAVHLKKHDMSLALNLTTALGGISPMAFFSDQTPTPTKFLEKCEEIGLFQELNKNPFDDSFKKAMDDPIDMENSAEDSSMPIPGPESHDLDTPQPTIPKVVVSSDSEDLQEIHMAGTKKKDAGKSSIVPKKRKQFLTQISQSMATSTTSEEEDVCVIDSSSTDFESPTPPKVPAKAHNSPPAVSSSTEEPKQKTVIVSECSNRATPIPAPTPPPAPTTVQVLLQLPGGLTVPVEVPVTMLTTHQQKSLQPQQLIQLPAMTSSAMNPTMVTSAMNPTFVTTALNPTIVSTAINPTIPTTALRPSPQIQVINTVNNVPHNLPHIRPFKLETSPLAQGAVGTVVSQKALGQSTVMMKTTVTPEKTAEKTHGGSLLYTKQRLKAALQQQMTPSSSQKISQIFQMVNEVKQEPQTVPQMSASPSPVDFSSLVSSSGSVSSSEDRYFNEAMQLDGMGFDYEDSDGRRKKFLERNRAAAARCRQKRKKWVTNLEGKAEELTNVNIKLSTEIKTLRGEVAELKTLLMAHKDCPVTQQQKNQGQITPQTYVIEPTQDDSVVVVDNHEDSDIPRTVTEVSISDALPNIFTINQSTSSNINASLVPNLNQFSLHPSMIHGTMLPSIISLDQSDSQTQGLMHTSVGGDLLPSVLTVSQARTETRNIHVITGPNSISMIPKIINMEQLMLDHNKHQKS